mmetsp:Transcript_12590/g.18891  ORF Transcript_12590/g.18891 Transcript_12590/m.18891 type:complete len:651 (-) Transcript_12590:4-1956(-)
MKSNKVVSDIQYGDFAKTQLVVFFVILLLAVDSINPVKIFLHVFPNVAPWHIAATSILLMIYVFLSEMKQLLYFSVKIFFHSILSIFFRDVSIIGKQNIPTYGPVIFTGNHANQFIDSVVMLSTCQRTISYLMAEKSYRRRIVGDIAWAMGVVPVKRAQDSARSGSGKITLEMAEYITTNDADSDTMQKLKVVGIDTNFEQEIHAKDKIFIKGLGSQYKVISVKSNTELEIAVSSIPSELIGKDPVDYEIMERIDQKVVYEKVMQRLGSGGTIGIFPEGGSHDRTDLLPLKVGVALIAYSALEKDGMSVPIVPVGMSYFRGHRFRGRVTVEYGRPIYIDPGTLSEYLKGGDSKKKVCNEVLERIEENMRGVIVSAPDYESLKIIHTARRLYRDKYISISEKQDLSRRFAEGYKHLFSLVEGEPPKEWKELHSRLEKYQDELDELGIRDYQVPGLEGEQDESDGRDKVMDTIRLPLRIAEILLLLFVSLLPALFLNLPVGLVARYWALHRRKKALAASKVKVKGMDVMLTEKVLLCMVLVPSLWVFYGVMLAFFTDLDSSAIVLAFLSFPLASYMGIVTTEAGIVELKDLKPVLKRLYPSSRRRLAALPELRRELQIEVRQFVKKIGPTLGKVYSEKEVDWAEHFHKEKTT